MNFTIATLLLQDGITSGAIYAILALALVLVFSVTRILFLPQGELVSLAALSLAALSGGGMPGTVWLMVVGAIGVAVIDIVRFVLHRDDVGHLKNAGVFLLIALVGLGVSQINPAGLSFWTCVALTFVICTPIAPIMYRLAFEPIANASVLTLLIAAVAVHFAVGGLALYMFGPEGVRTPAIVQSSLTVFDIRLLGQGLFVLGVTVVLSAALLVLFRYTLYGKMLLATAFNRVGAKLVGIKLEKAGVIAFALTGIIGTISGILASSLTTIYYDTGFTIGLKGFVAAIVGGLSSYPLAFAGALIIGILEGFSSFWYSQFKDVIVFSLVLPILLWKSMTSIHLAEDDDE